MADADRSFTIDLMTTIAHWPDGLIACVRLHAPKVADLWLWLEDDRETLSELRPYHPGMPTERVSR